MTYLIADKKNEKLKCEKSFDSDYINKKVNEYMAQGYQVYICNGENVYYQTINELCHMR